MQLPAAVHAGHLRRLPVRRFPLRGPRTPPARLLAIARLHVSAGTVEKHVAAIFGKLDLPVSEDHNRRVLAVIRMLHQDPRD